jgi:hypothetical protein
MESFDRRTLLLGLLGAGVTGALAGCSDGSSPVASEAVSPSAAPAPAATGSPSPSASPAVPRWPLTGKPLKNPDRARHAAVAVKVPDNVREHPQVGIDQADIVFVELDGYRDASGYSGTRLMPVFHSRMPDDVAPVRSIRPVDIPLLAPIGALVGNTGATGWVLNYVEQHQRYVDGSLSYMETKGTGSYGIDPDRVRTYQGVTYYDRAVVCHPKVLVQQTKAFRKGPRQVYFPFAETDDEVSTVSGRAARTVRVPWKQGRTYDMGYTWDEGSGRYLRSMPWGPHVLADGARVTTDNVLVVRAKQVYEKIYYGSGGDEPVHRIIRTKGTFVYAHGGRAVNGRWAKGGVHEPFELTLADGSPLRMAPGRTFVELPQAKADVVVKG